MLALLYLFALTELVTQTPHASATVSYQTCNTSESNGILLLLLLLLLYTVLLCTVLLLLWSMPLLKLDSQTVSFHNLW